MISPLLESVAPSVYTTYEQDHRALDAAFEALNQAVSVHDPLETARATKAFKFHLDLHLDKEDAHMYRLIGERVALPDQGQAVGQMAAHAPQDRFPEVVAWMFPLIGTVDRVSMTRSWQMGMPPEGFAMAATLIEQAVGDDWTELDPRRPRARRCTERREITMNDRTQHLDRRPVQRRPGRRMGRQRGRLLDRPGPTLRRDPRELSRPVPRRGSHSSPRPRPRRRLRHRTGHPRRRPRLATNGSALGVDLSSQMIALARTTAEDEGLDNVEFRHADAQIHPFEARARSTS